MHASMAHLTGTKAENVTPVETEPQSDAASKPGSFRNDPDDPSNPNEERERHLKKVDKTVDR